MLYHLLYQTLGDDTALRIFKYISLRAAMATLTAFLITFLLSPWFIRKLRQGQMKQTIRDDGPQSHLAKSGTPTMGGGIIIVSLGIATLLWARLDIVQTWVALLVTLVFGIVGFIDDYLKVTKKDPKGFKGSYKIVIEFAAAFIAVFVLLTQTSLSSDLAIPFVWEPIKDLPPWLFLPFGACVIVGTANAVNLTDGADGLALGPLMSSSMVFAILSYMAGNIVFASYLNVPYIWGAGELSVFCGAMFGAAMAFLWYNAHPASVFMGDVGALALGGGLCTVAVATKNELLILIVGGLFVMETLSVIIQVVSFKLTGKRVFRMAPFHHSLELNGWAEQKMVVRLWIVAIILALVGLSSLKLKFNI